MLEILSHFLPCLEVSVIFCYLVPSLSLGLFSRSCSDSRYFLQISKSRFWSKIAWCRSRHFGFVNNFLRAVVSCCDRKTPLHVRSAVERNFRNENSCLIVSRSCSGLQRSKVSSSDFKKAISASLTLHWPFDYQHAISKIFLKLSVFCQYIV